MILDFLLWIWDCFCSPDPNCTYSIIPALLSAAGVVGSTLLGSVLQKDANEDAWNKQNEYNSPRSQLQRIKQAGMSPALFYSNKQIQNASAPLETPDYPAAMNSAATAVTNAMNMALLKQQVKNAKTEGRVLAADADSKELDNEVKRVQKDVDISKLLAHRDSYIRFDANGFTLGMLDDEFNYNPMFKSDGSAVLGPEGIADVHLPFYEGLREALRNGFVADTEFFTSKMSQLDYAIKKEFGVKNAKAVIDQLEAAAYAAKQQGRDLQLDNDFFQNLKIEGTSLGGKSAEMLLKVILQVLARK